MGFKESGRVKSVAVRQAMAVDGASDVALRLLRQRYRLGNDSGVGLAVEGDRRGAVELVAIAEGVGNPLAELSVVGAGQ